MKKTVVVGMSGGVDSSVAAYLLKEQGYQVIGVTMQIWQEKDWEKTAEEGGCCGQQAVEDAKRVSDVLGIPHYVMNFRKEFKESVVDYFVKEYIAGRTPNPCIACNRYVKWEALLARSLEIGADYIATGHYARIIKLPDGRYTVSTAKGMEKDQTYALYNLTQEQLSHTLMPVGEYTKEEIRDIAESCKLPVAHKPDSQEICFVPEDDYAAFIEKEAGEKLPPPGKFVTKEGQVLGMHKGITHYTVGQRKGLGLSLGSPAFVTKIRPETNEVVVGKGEDVFTDRLVCKRLNFMGAASEEMQKERQVVAKIRYNHKGAPCVLTRTGEDEISCYFPEPVRAVTPGQAVVFYEDGYVLGGGTIL